jgi:hypothetical protein
MAVGRVTAGSTGEVMLFLVTIRSLGMTGASLGGVIRVYRKDCRLVHFRFVFEHFL